MPRRCRRSLILARTATNYTITLVIAEAALETVPAEISRHPSVVNNARRLGIKSSEAILDRSYHHAAMKGLENDWKRGRPDIVHFALMEALATPLFLKGMLRVYVHTINDKMISIAAHLRVPKSYFRFEGLMVSLFRDGMVKSDDGNILLELRDCTFESLIKEIKPDRVIGLSTAGAQSTAEQVVCKNVNVDHCAFVTGGFPRGHFSEKITKLFNLTYSISELGLESHVVIARVLYECEKALLEERVYHERDK